MEQRDVGSEGDGSESEGDEDDMRAEWKQSEDGGAQQTEKLERVRGRLREHAKFWETFCKSKFVMSVVRQGYKLEFLNDTPPPPGEFENARGIMEHEEFADDAIRKLVEQGAIKETRRERIKCVLAMDVKVNAKGKRRLCVDARPVNKYEVKRKFKFESLQKEGRDIFLGQKCGAIVDLSHAYHHIDMEEESTRYLGIKWKERYYVFKVLPFGLQSAPFVFCTVLAEVVRVFREKAIRVLWYMDDLPHADVCERRQLKNTTFIIQFLRRCGFIIEPEKKCVGYKEPLQTLPALGFDIDLPRQLYLVPSEKMERIEERARELMVEYRAGRKVQVKRLASMAGLVVSTGLALGGIVRIMTRHMYRNIGNRETRGEWKQKVFISGDSFGELKFIATKLRSFNGKPISRVGDNLVEIQGCSDASDVAYGGFLQVAHDPDGSIVKRVQKRALEKGMTIKVVESVAKLARTGIEFRGELTREQQEKSSTWREGYGLERLVDFAAPFLKGMRLKVNLDNIALVFGLGGSVRNFEEKVYGGSKKYDIQKLLRKIIDRCIKDDITMLANWVPRDENERADYLSKMTTHYDFALGRWSFRRCEQAWGPHSIDRFSSSDTVLVSSGRYNARFLQAGEAEGCEGIDAFNYDWSGENNWCHAPFKLIGQVVNHMRSCGATGTILVPMWKKAAWWPLLRSEDGEHWADDVVDGIHIGHSRGWNGGQGAIVAAKGGSLEDIPKADLWALRLSCV